MDSASLSSAAEAAPRREALAVNAQGHLTIGGMDVPALAAQYGTPLYIMDEAYIRSACRRYQAALHAEYGENSMAAFAGKSLCVSAMYRLLAEEGMAADVVSGGELYTALHAGFDASRAFFHGNNKTDDELRLGLEAGLGYFVLDNAQELTRLATLAKAAGKKPQVLLRVTPGVEAHTHSYVKTGQIDSKFGAILENGDALALVGRILHCPDVIYAGLHCHIGSQILDAEPFAHTAEVMAGLMADIRKTWGADTPMLNLGGGYGIRYTDETPLTPEDGVKRVAAALKKALRSADLPLPTLVLEPGRSIVAPAGITVYTVGHVKEIPGIRTYVSVDGGMTDNPRYILYHANYEFLLPEKADQPRTQTVTIAGRCCESGDLLGEGVPIQPVQAGDLLCTLDTGAYCYSMSSHYNRVPGAAMVFVRDGASRLVVRRETFADMVKNDVL